MLYLENNTSFLLPYFLTSDVVLPAEIGGEAVVWRSSLFELLDKHGQLVSQREEISPEFRLTANTNRQEYSFTVRLLGEERRWLAGYTREPNENSNVYSRFVADSLHLALSREREEGGFEALNSNYGVLFAKADYSRSEAGETKLLQMPRFFRLAGQGFGILAIPLDYEEHVDGPGELLYFETQDFVHYEEKNRIKITQTAWLDYSCELDAATRLYRIGWKEESGETRFVTTKDFKDFSLPQPGVIFPARFAQLPIEGARAGQLIALTASEAAYLEHKLGRVRHVSVDDPIITLNAGAPSLNLNNARVTARYTDGSVALKRIEVDRNEAATIDLSQPGRHELEAKIVRHRFPYPMMNTRPDPYVLLYKGRYYFISTDDDWQRKIFIRSSETLEGLEDGKTEEVLLWNGNVPEGERRGEHWAPELHVICGKLYCFLAISVNNAWDGVQAHVALLEGEDPMNPAHWGTPQRVLNRHGEVLTDTHHRERDISLDMTYFELGGKSYVCWSQPKWIGEEQELAALYMATVNPEQPWRLTSDPVRICRNEYGWDRNGGIASGVSEGPYVLKQGSRMFMIFSGSGVGPTYAVGMMEMSAAEDPLDIHAWRKYNYPLMHSLSQPGQYGPGHNMFAQDEFGDWFNVYHACGVNGGHRHASIRPVHFRFDGSPILDMKDEEELLPEYERITLTVVVN
ncbi:family 43 glycosylhydrolase [Paenibacillus puldeungensis]|uniref:Family 43 glycosylhydrolase n=1 Tax=Paenibacillus puldeungensis TaxID=696536 RepID=A0ABW3RW00_9BACL